MHTGGRYRLAPGVDVVRVASDAVCFRSDTVMLRLEGPSAIRFAEQILPLLDGSRSVGEVAAAVPGLDADDLDGHLAELAKARVLMRRDGSTTSDDGGPLDPSSPFGSMLHALGLPLDRAAGRLRDLHVVVFGVEAHGAYAADALARAGVGRLTLVDPFAIRAADHALLPLLPPDTPTHGVLRQQLVRDVLAAAHPGTRVDCWTKSTLERDDVRALAETANVLIGAFDRGFAAAHQWINRASLDRRIPALFGELRGARIVAGPLVLPEESACYLCAKMREAACADDFREAMAYEEHLDRQRTPAQASRPAFPGAAMHLGALLAMELLRTTLALAKPALANNVEELDLLTGERTMHAILQRPDCPACRKKRAAPPPTDPGVVPHARSDGADLLDAVPELVSARYGVIRSFEPVTKDPSEPLLPYIFRAELANHRFTEHSEDAFVTCSGKGFTLSDARVSALGEAAERYSGSMWGPDDVVQARREDLPGTSLDPRRLVLYADAQYPTLRYAPYSDAATIGWVTARSVGSAEVVHVPAIGVYMAYEPQSHDELLFPPTSNGLAAGRTLADAVLSAAFEVLERDAFVCTWLNRIPAQRVDPLDHPDPRVTDMVRAYGRRGVQLELYRLATDHPCHVFLGMGVADRSDDGPAVVVGLGAHLDAARAARSALLEVGQVRPALRIRLRDPAVARRRDELVEAPHRVETLEEHDLLYTDRRMMPSFAFLRDSPMHSMEWGTTGSPDAHQQLAILADALHAVGTELLYRDLTTADLAMRGAHTARAIIPDFQPIYFGEQERRLGGRRLFDMPRLLGIRDRSTSLAGLNPDPHPLA